MNSNMKSADSGDALVFSIAPDDPMFVGHFPGQPVVPGVVLLDRAMALIAASGGPDIEALRSAKFLRPVLPAQRVVVRFHVVGDKLDIEASVAGDIVMRAAASIAPT